MTQSPYPRFQSLVNIIAKLQAANICCACPASMSAPVSIPALVCYEYQYQRHASIVSTYNSDILISVTALSWRSALRRFASFSYPGIYNVYARVNSCQTQQRWSRGVTTILRSDTESFQLLDMSGTRLKRLSGAFFIEPLVGSQCVAFQLNQISSNNTCNSY